MIFGPHVISLVSLPTVINDVIKTVHSFDSGEVSEGGDSSPVILSAH